MADRLDHLFGIPYAHHTAPHLELILNYAGLDTKLGESKQTLFELAQGFERGLDERTRHNIKQLVEDLVLQRRNLRRKEEQLKHVLILITIDAEIAPREPRYDEDEDMFTGFGRGEVIGLDEDGDKSDAGNDHLWNMNVTGSVEPELRTCELCLEELAIDYFPLRRITSTCEHETEVCLDHLRQYIIAHLMERHVDELTCPSCDERMSNEDVQILGDQELFDAYCQRAFLGFLQKEQNYYHCLGPSCGASQIHEQEEEAAPLMRCHSCGFRTCIRHQIAWHDGQTCEDYDLWKAENLHRDQENVASEVEMLASSKRCPECSAPVVKIDGCDHITCRCGFEFCWVCLVPWTRVPHGAFHGGA